MSLQPGSFLHATLITNCCVPRHFDPDGLESDGQGNVYFASEDYGVTTKSTSTTSPPGT